MLGIVKKALYIAARRVGAYRAALDMEQEAKEKVTTLPAIIKLELWAFSEAALIRFRQEDLNCIKNQRN